MRHALAVILLFVVGSAQAALVDRGGGFIYDDVLDITWTQAANINGRDTWANQVAWADSLSLFDSVRGVTWNDWRLPSADVNGDETVVNCSSAMELACRDNEYGYLFHQYGIRGSAPGPFTNVQTSYYWSDTEFRPNLAAAWSFFFFGGGSQGGQVKTDDNYAWAVRDGDVGVVPVPSTLIDRGNGFIYDETLNITWLQDANFAQTSGFDADGRMNWDEAVAWADGLSITDTRPGAGSTVYDDWRLASMSVAAGLPTGRTTSVLDCATVWQPLCADNELSYMFYYHLGGTLGSNLTGDQSVGGVTLNNIQPLYWSGTEFADGSAWIIHFTSGFGVWSFKSGLRSVWAVRDGDVAPIPVSIDVQPDDPTNFVRTDGNFSDKMFVSVEGSPEFDATQVDSATVKFGPGEAAPIIIPGTILDTNDDGINDMRLKFRIADTGLTCEYPDGVTLTGETNGGLIQFEGSDSVTTESCEPAGCHP